MGQLFLWPWAQNVGTFPEMVRVPKAKGYSLNRHPSGPENWPFFQRSHACAWQCCTLKCSATRPAFSPVRNISRLFYFVFLLCQNQFQSRYSRQKWRQLTAWTLDWRISQLIAGESTLRSGTCFGTFLRLHFQSSLWQVRNENSEENEKKETTYTPPFQFRHWTCVVHIPGNTMGNPFFATTWMYGFVAFCFHLESCSVKVCLNWCRKLTEHFDTKYGWIEDDCGKNCRQKLGPLGCPFRLEYG